MAMRRRFRGRGGYKGGKGGGSPVLRALGGVVTLLVSLYAFDKIIAGLMAGGLGASTYFSAAVALMVVILPVIGIIAGAALLIQAVRALKLF